MPPYTGLLVVALNYLPYYIHDRYLSNRAMESIKCQLIFKN